jgi:hypothetical protein
MTEAEYEQHNGQFWSGTIEMQGGFQLWWAKFTWQNEEPKFQDIECHNTLCSIADSMKLKKETVCGILLGFYNSYVVVSTRETSLRDLLYLKPEFITIITTQPKPSKGSLVNRL